MSNGNSLRLPPRSQLGRVTEADSFLWCTGIEDTFVLDPHSKTGRALDEYELTGHYQHLNDDLHRIAELGVSCARYGVPWYKCNPEKGVYDWSFADQAFETLLNLGVDPIVDLVHYGTPHWMEGSFLNPDFPRHMADFGATLAQRYKERIKWFTPLNEPRITAYYCGKLGNWPPYRSGWSGFVTVMLACCKGIVLTSQALASVDPDIVRCHVDATDIYQASEPAHQADAELRQHIVFLALDLISGRVDSRHPLWEWVIRHGASVRDLEWFLQNPVELDIVGINLYPMFSLKVSRKTGYRMPYAGNVGLVERLGKMYWERYQRPIMITETASAGSVRRRKAWLDESVADCQKLREQGIPLIGYTWWPLFSLVAWSYRKSQAPLSKYLIHMGLWDLGEGLARVRTPLIDAYKETVKSGAPGKLEGVRA
jgi:beta-glucosidase/6-phospho-beta-glucosidase/beta-galactosidase